MKKKQGDKSEEVSAQAEMPGTEEVSTPARVQDGQILMRIVKVSLRLVEGKRLVAVYLSTAVDDDSVKAVDKRIARGYHDVADGTYRKTSIQGLRPQTIEFRNNPEDEHPILQVLGARLENPSLDLIEQRGEGQAKDVIRLSYVLILAQERKQLFWLAENHGTTEVWVAMAKTQRDLLPEQD